MKFLQLPKFLMTLAISLLAKIWFVLAILGEPGMVNYLAHRIGVEKQEICQNRERTICERDVSKDLRTPTKLQPATPTLFRVKSHQLHEQQTERRTASLFYRHHEQ